MSRAGLLDCDRLAIARLVADFWRASAVADGNDEVPWRFAAHPLCCVLAALDGESDPAQLGVAPGCDTAAAIRSVVERATSRSKPSPSDAQTSSSMVDA